MIANKAVGKFSSDKRHGNDVLEQNTKQELTGFDNNVVASGNTADPYQNLSPPAKTPHPPVRRRIFCTAQEDDGDEEEEEDEYNDEVADQRSNSTYTKGELPQRSWRHRPSGKKGLDTFRRIVDFVLLAQKLFSNCSRERKFTQEESILFFLDIPAMFMNPSKPNVDHSQTDKAPLFDIEPYRAIKEQNLVSLVRATLTIPPAERKKEEVSSLIHTLKTFSQFAGYPRHVQRRLCEQGWHTRFETSQVLCRQGQKAETFYFILSGLALSRPLGADDESEKRSQRRCQKARFLRRGDAIGERELLLNETREETIICKEPVEVLGLDKQEFLLAFRSTMGDDANCLAFIKSIEVLRDLPLDLLQNEALFVSSRHYRRGAVVVANCNESEWICIIKSGTCHTYKALKPRSKDRRKRLLVDKHAETKTPRAECESGFLPPIHNTTVSPRVKTTPRTDSVGLTLRVSRSDDSIHLPRLNNGGNKGLVTRGSNDSGYISTQSDDETTSRRRRSKDGTLRRLPDIQSPEPPDSFARVQVVSEKDVFGLQAMLYEDSPSFSLVSNGAECVLISKAFIRQHLNQSRAMKLRKLVAPYSTASSLQTALEEKLHWERYKNMVVRDVVK